MCEFLTIRVSPDLTSGLQAVRKNSILKDQEVSKSEIALKYINQGIESSKVDLSILDNECKTERLNFRISPDIKSKLMDFAREVEQKRGKRTTMSIIVVSFLMQGLQMDLSSL